MQKLVTSYLLVTSGPGVTIDSDKYVDALTTKLGVSANDVAKVVTIQSANLSLSVLGATTDYFCGSDQCTANDFMVTASVQVAVSTSSRSYLTLVIHARASCSSALPIVSIGALSGCAR